MSADTAPPPALTPREQTLVDEALRRAQDDLYRAVLARVTRTFLIGAAASLAGLLLIGWLAFGVLRARIVENAVASLGTDERLRASLIAGLGLDTTALRASMAQLDALTGMMGAAGASGGAGGSAGANGLGGVGELDTAELERLLQRLLSDMGVPR